MRAMMLSDREQAILLNLRKLGSPGCDERSVERELALAQRHGACIITQADADYPAVLRLIPDPPAVLYLRGTLTAADAVAVALVGSRRASLYGLQSAERLAYELALRGVTVVSGLARGIDGAAHQGALNGSGRTLAVLGCGLSRIYPPEHDKLAEQVAAHGALISEYPMDAQPMPYNFPRRNRLISGLSQGVVVVEASHRSGALITADCALEQSREVFAVPGPMTSATSHGTHRLIKDGARLVTSVEDILAELGLSPLEASLPPSAEPIRLPEAERKVFEALDARAPRYIDAIAHQSGVAMPELAAALLQLELKRLIQQLPGRQFIRRGKDAGWS